METKHTAGVITTGGRNGRVRSESGSFRLSLSSFESLGSNYREGTNPEELLGAAYGANFGSLMEKVAKEHQIELQSNFSITSKVCLKEDENKKLFLKINLNCFLPDLKDEDAIILIQKTKEICPYCKVFKDNITIKVCREIE